MATTIHIRGIAAGRRTFTRILVGVDGSQESLEAARQAALLQDPAGQLTLLSAWDVTPLIGASGEEFARYLDGDALRRGAESSLAEAREYVAPYAAATTKLVRGAPVPELLEEIDRDEDTLVAVGPSAGGRLMGALAGGVATGVIHRAPCSVLVARPTKNGFPHRIVVGVDGSVESAAAYAAARYLAERFDGELHPLVAWGGKSVSERLVAAITDGEHADSEAGPADALIDAAESADLLVVGSRGQHGIRALGSVSERVAHSASCSTLVIREPSWQRIALELGC